MKRLLTVTILLTFFCANLSFAQHSGHFFTNGLPKTNTSRTIVSPRNNATKRLHGESRSVSSLIGAFTSYGDSSQYFYGPDNSVAERRNWAREDSIWSLASRTQFLTYDSAGNSLLEIFQITSDGGASWENNERITQTYNAAGQITSSAIQFWSVFTNDWQVASPVEYEYDQHGNLVGSINGDYITNTLYTYNDDGFPVIITDRSKNSLDSVWNYIFQRHLVYDTVHPELLVYETGSEFNTLTNAFYVVDSAAYYYDNTGNMIHGDFFDFENVNNALGCLVVHRLFQSFDNQNRVSQGRYYVACRQDTTLTGQLESIIDHTYDMDGDQLYVLQTYFYDTDTDIYFYRYTYETVSRVQQPFQTIDFVLYPNPSAGMIAIKATSKDLQRANVFDTQGCLLFSQALQGSESGNLNLAGMPNGSYILQVIQKDGKTAAKSFVIVH